MNFETVGIITQLLHLAPADGLQLLGTTKLATQHHPQLEPTLPLLLFVDSVGKELSTIGRPLENCYPLDHEVTLFTIDTDEKSLGQRQVPLRELTELLSSLTTTYIYMPALKPGGSFGALLEIVAHLRAPNGCPWDREQTMATLRHDLLDEASELLEAIDIDLQRTEANVGNNTVHIVEELGDLLLLPAMMTQIAAEEGRFQMAQVTRGIVEKLIRRHPHVFGNIETDNVDEIVVNWDAIKAQEKAERGELPVGPLEGIPAALPSLEKARKMQSKAQKAGLIDRKAVAESATRCWNALLLEPSETLLGEFLWSLVALAQNEDINAENALRSHTTKFKKQIAA